MNGLIYISGVLLIGGFIFMKRDRTTSPAGLDLLKGFEGFSPTPYRDAHGFSIGYGHFIKDGENLTHVTLAEGEKLLARDLGIYENVVNSTIEVQLSQNMFDALVLLTYNIGGTNFKSSTLAKVLNRGDYSEAQRQFLRWNKSRDSKDGDLKVNPVLVSRREKEAQLFFS